MDAGRKPVDVKIDYEIMETKHELFIHIQGITICLSFPKQVRTCLIIFVPSHIKVLDSKTFTDMNTTNAVSVS